jgi:hypothetical protein
VKCGNPDCPNQHGPYVYVYWKQDKKLNKRYVGKKLSLRKIAKDMKVRPRGSILLNTFVSKKIGNRLGVI